MRDEAMCHSPRHKNGYWHVDQEGARRIEDGQPLMQDEEVLRLDRLEH